MKPNMISSSPVRHAQDFSGSPRWNARQQTPYFARDGLFKADQGQ
jgi:hypothetical protein